ncbi:hypothetical protein NPIL_674791 [Nephila pilipes]|uniref:Uncharacterized protein n=1 Tax=Nephila pilipes TaxID=299642 RepID=A0A8X6MK20_NEPPI|nr:hypothetical protein NPIL_674791 [Nephila pilipes]
MEYHNSLSNKHSEISEQTEANKHYNNQHSKNKTRNPNTENFYDTIELIGNLGKIFNKLPELLKHLPKIKAAKGSINKRYALIDALMDDDNDIAVPV